MIRLWSFSINIDENEVCSKKIDQIFKNINIHSPLHIEKMSIVCVTDKLFCNRKSFVWPNYFVLEKPLWKHESTVKFGAYIFLQWYLKKKKHYKHKYDVKWKIWSDDQL